MTSSSSRQVSLGIVGVGYMGQIGHLMNYVEIKNCKIVAVAEKRPMLREKVAQRFNIEKTYSSHKELIKDTEIEAVAVIVKRTMTGPVALDCLTAGKAVITEKPMASTVDQARRLVKTAEKSSLVYKIGYMRLFDEGVQKAKVILDNLLKTQELGAVIYARAHCFGGSGYCNIDGHIMTDETSPLDGQHWPESPEWLPNNLSADYHRYLNVYCHNVNLIRYLFGKTPAVKYVNFTNTNGQIAILDFGGFIVSLETGQYSYHGWDEKIEIFFEHGRLTIRTPPQMLRNMSATIELYKAGNIQEVSMPLSGWTWSFRRQAESFIDDVMKGSVGLASGKDSLEDMILIEKMWKSQINAD